MMGLRNIIEQLVETTDKSNADIHSFLNNGGLSCSKRTVRRHANPVRSRLGGDIKEAAKILLFDLETAPMEVYVWGLRQASGWIQPHSIIKDWSVLTWSAKWLFDAEVMSARVSPDEATARTDSSVMQGLWNLLDSADIVIAHNGARFDIRKINARFILNGYSPPMPYRIIDTLRVARRQFDFSSYKLDYINKLFGIGTKTETKFDLWKDCVTGSAKALTQMSEYCDNDVLILEEQYLAVRPWIKGHPNLALFVDTDQEICTNCGCTELEWKGRYFTPAGRYKAFRCTSCGAIGRSRYSDLSKEDRDKIHLSIT
jgi:hypothetical protein